MHLLSVARSQALCPDGQQTFAGSPVVEVIRRDDDYVYVGTGVDEGETYCLTPLDQPLPGMQVRVSG